MGATDSDLALRYLADAGFTPIGPQRWRRDGTPPEEMSDEDVATGPLHLRARHVLEDSGSVDWDDMALLDSLRLPADTEHLPQLRAVLGRGVPNHHKDPAAWRE